MGAALCAVALVVALTIRTSDVRNCAVDDSLTAPLLDGAISTKILKHPFLSASMREGPAVCMDAEVLYLPFLANALFCANSCCTLTPAQGKAYQLPDALLIRDQPLELVSFIVWLLQCMQHFLGIADSRSEP